MPIKDDAAVKSHGSNLGFQRLPERTASPSPRFTRRDLIPEFTYRIRTESPLPLTEGSPFGQRHYAILAEGEIEGPRLRAKLAAPGSDWMGVGSDGYFRPDVRVAFLTDDGATLLLQCSGLIEQTPAFMQAVEQNRTTEWADQYMRLFMRFDAGAARYRWLTTSLFVARGRLLGTGRVECAVYRLA